MHVVSDDPALLQRLLGSGFVPGLDLPPQTLGPMHTLTPLLLKAFDGPGGHETLGVEHVLRSTGATASSVQAAPGS